MRDEQIPVDPEEAFDTYELDESWEEEDAWTEPDIREDTDTWDGGLPSGGGSLIYDQCGYHEAGETATLQFGYLFSPDLLTSNDWFSEPVYYWKHNNGNYEVHAIGKSVVDAGGAPGIEITAHS